jgi:hypothetical protein
VNGYRAIADWMECAVLRLNQPMLFACCFAQSIELVCTTAVDVTAFPPHLKMTKQNSSSGL